MGSSLVTEKSQSIELNLEVSFVVFRSPDSPFAVVKGKNLETGKFTTASGKLGKPAVGDRLKIFGDWTTHPKFGPQFQGDLEDFNNSADRDTKRLIGLIKGAGIEDKRFIDSIYNTPPTLHYKAAQNPYILLDALPTATWDIVDRLAQKIGLMPESEMRVSAAIRHTLNKGNSQDLRKELERTAACWASPKILLPEAARLLGFPTTRVNEILAEKNPASITAIQHPAIGIMDSRLAGFEDSIANAVRELVWGAGQVPESIGSISGQLSEQQAVAVFSAIHQGLSIITGGPGVGKTRCVAEIARLLNEAGREVVLAAPTGKAAYRMAESVNRLMGSNHSPIPHKTIHRLLECLPALGGGFDFQYGKHQKLKPATYIIDEASMIPTELMGAFLEAIGPDSKVIFVGDPNQLPPVGQGQPFIDMLNSGAIPIHRLTQIFRQAEGSAIAESCRIALEGEAHQLFSFLRQEGQKEIEYISVGSDDQIAKIVGDHFHCMGEDRIILAPLNKNAAGTTELNQVLQHMTTSHRESLKITDDFYLHSGDPVIQIRNNYARDGFKGIFNGDMGVAHIEELLDSTGRKTKQKGARVEFEQASEIYNRNQAFGEIKLAYAVSIHKSQGSEWQEVLLVLPSSAKFFLSRRLLYTALSRAKKRLTIIANPIAIHAALSRREADLNIQTRLGWLLGQQKLKESQDA